MSVFSEIAKRRRERGEQARATFKPKIDGTPAKLYKWWQRKTRSRRPQENFCHYWRVVLIWAPLLGLRLGITAALRNRIVQISLGLIAVAGFISACVIFGSVLKITLISLGVILGIVWFIVSMVIGASWAIERAGKGDDDEFRRLFNRKQLFAVVFILTAPGFIVGFLVVSASYALENNWRRIWRWFAIKPLLWGLTPLRLMLVAIALAIETLAIIMQWWWVPIASLGLILLVFAVLVAVEIGSSIKAKAIQRRVAIRRTKQAEKEKQLIETLTPALRVLFTQLHPTRKGSEQSFSQWRARYVRSVWQDWEFAIASRVLPWQSHYRLSEAVTEEIRAIIAERFPRTMEQMTEAPTTPRKPSRLVKVFRGTWEFLVLIYTAVRVAKWRICPIVEFEK